MENKDKETLNELKTNTLLSYRGKAVEKMGDKNKLANRVKGIARSGQIVKSRMQKKDVNEQKDNPDIYADTKKRPTPISPSGPLKNEQHAEVGRFKPVKPHNVQNVAGASPRPTSDSANVKLKEESLNELSMQKLTQYKTAASKSASEADKAGDIAKGNKRFSGIIKATKKQFGKTMKEEKQIDEAWNQPDYSQSIKSRQAEADKKSKAWKKETEWKKSDKPDTIVDKSGAKHTPMSRARDLARDAMKKTSMKKEENGEEMKQSRKAKIVRDAFEKGKQKTSGTKDKFEADPELSTEIMRND